MEQGRRKIAGANILCLCLVCINIAASLILNQFEISTPKLLILSQALILIPVIIYTVITKQNIFKLIRFHKFHIGSAFLVMLLVFCVYPLLIVVNALSQLFAANVIKDTTLDITNECGLGVSLLLMAVMPAIVEETTYRGVIMNSYREEKRTMRAILFSALMFSSMHMNFNQWAYAFVMAVIMGIVLEVTDSIISTMIIHFMFNGGSVVMLFLLPKMIAVYNKLAESQGMNTQISIDEMLNQTTTKTQMISSIVCYLPVAAAGLVFAGLLTYAIAKLNHRETVLNEMFGKKIQEEKAYIKSKSQRIIDIPWGIAVAICFAISIATEIMIRI